MPFEEEEDEASQTLHSKNVEITLKKHVSLHRNHAKISLASFYSRYFLIVTRISHILLQFIFEIGIIGILPIVYLFCC